MYIITVDGSSKPLNSNSLEALQEAVGGYIEIVPALDDEQVLIIHEQGKLMQKPINAEATKLYKHGQTDPIVGDVVVAYRTEIE